MRYEDTQAIRDSTELSITINEENHLLRQQLAETRNDLEELIENLYMALESLYEDREDPEEPD